MTPPPAACATPLDRRGIALYATGQRVALDATTDPHTELRPGDEGTVRSYHPAFNKLDVDWDSGSRLSMLLDEGDNVRLLPS
ncbi:DUF4314 domain-containing protein [Streptomyces canus]|uniref:DUF4314 domain-containing protein n=1 Tax=Streptomyces canus TaxID=58343 RepID=UPI0022509759|nr:DUF4314 domain-containing protein [Streptomyces canus]MCX4858290.1 DUF4314 domain-containing protein [Streptomyces canus]